MMDPENIEMTELHFMDDQEAVKEEIGQIMSRIPDRCDKVFCEEVYSDTQKVCFFTVSTSIPGKESLFVNFFTANFIQDPDREPR